MGVNKKLKLVAYRNSSFVIKSMMMSWAELGDMIELSQYDLSQKRMPLGLCVMIHLELCPLSVANPFLE